MYINFGIAIELKQVNPGQVGFYRVCYDKETVEKFVPAIKDMSLPPLDRVGIQNDQFALVIVKSYLLINQQAYFFISFWACACVTITFTGTELIKEQNLGPY